MCRGALCKMSDQPRVDSRNLHKPSLKHGGNAVVHAPAQERARRDPRHHAGVHVLLLEERRAFAGASGRRDRARARHAASAVTRYPRRDRRVNVCTVLVSKTFNRCTVLDLHKSTVVDVLLCTDGIEPSSPLHGVRLVLPLPSNLVTVVRVRASCSKFNAWGASEHRCSAARGGGMRKGRPSSM